MPEHTVNEDRYHLDGHKLWWHLERLAAWQRGELIAPIYLEVSPTTVCNQRCLFCALDFAQDQPRYLDAEAFDAHAQELAALGVRSLLLAGEGEPLLHRELPRMITAAHQAGLDVALNTNASLGSRDLWREILPALTWMRVSLDAGSAETYALVHGTGRDAFALVQENLAAALEARRILGAGVTIGAQYVLIQSNAGDLENALRLTAELGLDYFSVKPFSRHPLMRRQVDAAFEPQALDELEELCREYHGRGGLKVLFRRRAFDAELAGALGFSRCRAMPFFGYVSTDGVLHTCNVLLNDPRFMVGSLGQASTRELILGQARQQAMEQGRSMDLAQVCRRNCRAARMNEFLEQLSEVPQHVNFI